jgi:cyclophilin family peptidyl-prolyl cis-trans isomerase
MKGTICTTVIIMLLLLSGCGASKRHEVAILETDFGPIVLQFNSQAAPLHVEHFKQLCREGFYDGILFHRVIPGFVIQAGDVKTKDSTTPRSDYGTGKSEATIDAEISDRKHVRGTLGMARLNTGLNTASTQFYICLDRIEHLDGSYTIFGTVLSGMEVVDSIASVERDVRNVPIHPVSIRRARIVHRKEVEQP